MVKCPGPLEQYIDKNTSWFEKSVLAVCRNDLDSFRKFSTVLCLKSGTKDKLTEDFNESFHNIIYAGIKYYNTMFEDATASSFKPINNTWMRSWLTGRANAGEMVMLSEVDTVAAYFDEHVAAVEVDANLLYIVNKGIGYYLRSVRAKKILHSASLSGLNLDDLALLCENDMEVIKRVDGAARVTSDTPDRIKINDIAEFDDPNKAIADTLDCDIPRLNEALSSFMKGKAYLFIGPTGAGKTILGCQLACSFSYNNAANGLYISTEQPHDELYRRIISNRCGIPHKSIRAGIYKDQMTARELNAFINFRQKIQKLNVGNIQFVNWGNFEKQNNFKVAKKIEEEIDLYERDSGLKVDYVILDWIGGALGAMAESADKVRHVYQDTADALEELARKRNFVACAFAQAHVSAVNKVKVDSLDLQECKSMGRNYTGIIGITSLYSAEYAKQMASDAAKKKKDYRVDTDIEDTATYANKQYLFLSKSRFGEAKAIPFLREYEFQRVAPWT